MDAQQALADLTEISSQIQAAVVFDEQGKVAASTLEEGRADALAEGVGRLLEQALDVKVGAGGPLIQLEAATDEGSVFVVADGPTRIAATTAPDPRRPARRRSPRPAIRRPMRRSVAALVGVAGGMLAGAAFIRRRTVDRDRVDLYYQDGSMVSLSNGSPGADRLLPLAREILRKTR
ncbi:MAG: hypothetical protein E6G50_04385 [Actinobacteria bacterium]|nr:MAG: hypothetical protein E6G50_04385 [Actinomycetota bacterium]